MDGILKCKADGCELALELGVSIEKAKEQFKCSELRGWCSRHDWQNLTPDEQRRMIEGVEKRTIAEVRALKSGEPAASYSIMPFKCQKCGTELEAHTEAIGRLEEGNFHKAMGWAACPTCGTEHEELLPEKVIRVVSRSAR